MNARGFTLAEVAVATALVGTLLVASLNVVGGSAAGQARTADLERARLLAQDMLAEVTIRAYEDQDSPMWGVEPGEAGINRMGFDDVDDYADLTESPPVWRDGSAIAGADGWIRSTVVECAATANPAQTVQIDQGLKRITVTVSRNGAVMARLVAIRSRGRDEFSR